MNYVVQYCQYHIILPDPIIYYNINSSYKNENIVDTFIVSLHENYLNNNNTYCYLGKCSRFIGSFIDFMMDHIFEKNIKFTKEHFLLFIQLNNKNNNYVYFKI